MNELCAFTGRCSQGSQLCLPNAEGGSTLCRGAPATRGRCGPLSRERPSQPGGVFLSRFSLPGLTSGLGARPPLSVLLRSPGAGPGRAMAAEGGGAWRPRSALNPRNFRSPTTFPRSAAALGAWTEGEGEAGSLGGSGGEPERLEPAAEAVAESAPASRRRGPRLLRSPAAAEAEPSCAPRG